MQAHCLSVCDAILSLERLPILFLFFFSLCSAGLMNYVWRECLTRAGKHSAKDGLAGSAIVKPEHGQEFIRKGTHPRPEVGAVISCPLTRRISYGRVFTSPEPRALSLRDAEGAHAGSSLITARLRHGLACHVTHALTTYVCIDVARCNAFLWQPWPG